MSNTTKPAPKHRGAARPAQLSKTPKKALRNVAAIAGVAAAVTGIAIGGGLAAQSGDAAPAAAVSLDKAVSDARAHADSEVAAGTSDTGDRAPVVSRSDHRGKADPAKKAGLVQGETAAMTEEKSLSQSDPRDIGRALMGDYGFGQDQFSCLDSLWTRESNWNVNADNPSSSAYGIPQALPGSKMSSAGSDWATNPATQIKWGLGYIRDRYGSPCSAWGHSESTGWY